MKVFIILAGLLVWAAPLLAETYTWIDENGTCNFTEDYTHVPKQYRKNVEKRGDMDGQTVDSQELEPALKSKSVSSQKAVESGNKGTENDGLYGGKRPEAWQKQMRPLYSEIKQLEQQLTDLEALIRKPVGISDSRANGLPQEFKKTQKLYRDTLNQYNCLNDEANKVGLPAEFRR